MKRGDVLWRGRVVILIVALILAAVAGSVAALRSVPYSAQATVRVSLLQESDAGAQNAMAANELAAQYALIATSDPVLDAAAKELGASRNELSGAVSASVVNNYNVVRVTARANGAERSADTSVAVAQALVDYLNSSYDASVEAAKAASADELERLNRSIRTAQQAIADSGAGNDTESAGNLASARSLLSSLVSVRENLYLAPTRQAAQSRPDLSILNSPQTGERPSRQVPLYALLGFVVGVLVAAQVVLIRHDRRTDVGLRDEATSSGT